MEKQINILLVDDHQMLSDSLKRLLNTEANLRVVATAKDGEGALRYCHNYYSELDIILMDIKLPAGGPSGLELTEQIKKKYPKIKVLVCSGHDEIVYIQRAKKMGADGYVKKDASGVETVEAINEVIKGNKVWPPLNEPSIEPIEIPTPTEMEVLKYVARGMQNKQIGVELAMSERTVSVHIRNIKPRYKLKTRGELILFAGKCMGLFGIPPDPQLSGELNNRTGKFKKDTGITVKFDGDNANFNNATNRAISRVVEEALRTIKHHADVKNVCIQLHHRNSAWATLTICADGTGFKDQNDDGAGFKKAQEIADEAQDRINALNRILRAIGGELAFDFPPGGGATLIATLRRT
jgi:DNA-binding NarL/FixJ family response regulator